MICKICKKEFTQSHKLQIMCSELCKQENKKIIKRNYYDRNTDLCKERVRKLKELGYKYVPSPEKKEEIRKRSRAWYYKKMMSDPSYFKKYYSKANNTEQRKQYMREYRMRSGQIEKERDRAKKYRSKDTTPQKRKSEHLKSRYGINVQDYEMMLMSQSGVCKICKQFETRKQGKNGEVSRLAVDHCHNTGKIRGLLCYRCNVTIGFMKDNPVLLRLAAEYLEESQK